MIKEEKKKQLSAVEEEIKKEEKNCILDLNEEIQIKQILKKDKKRSKFIS